MTASHTDPHGRKWTVTTIEGALIAFPDDGSVAISFGTDQDHGQAFATLDQEPKERGIDTRVRTVKNPRGTPHGSHGSRSVEKDAVAAAPAPDDRAVVIEDFEAPKPAHSSSSHKRK